MSTIVFCEDDPSIRKLIDRAMRGSGHTIHVATDGEEGLRLVEGTHPDLVVADVAMPVVNGIELAERIRSSAEIASTAIVFMTASVQRRDLAEYQRLTEIAPLEKPFSIAELRARITGILEEVSHGR